MKRDDIKKIFEGATDEQISAVLNINSADIGAAKKKLEDERDSYKAQLETATQKLEGFKDVNVEELKGKIETLTGDLACQKAAFEKQLADRDFDDLLNGEIRGSKAKNVTAVRALLDVETLKTSKNQKDDIAAALQKTKEENGYLFESDEPIDNGTFVGGTSQNPKVRTLEEIDKMSFDEYRKYRQEN